MKAMPDVICPYCREYDWMYNEDTGEWDCDVCSKYGRPEVEPPTINSIDKVDEWVDIALKDYDTCFDELESAKAAPKNGDAESIYWMARVRKAERKLKVADAKAEVANSILELQRVHAKGDIYFDLPDVDLKIRIKW